MNGLRTIMACILVLVTAPGCSGRLQEQSFDEADADIDNLALGHQAISRGAFSDAEQHYSARLFEDEEDIEALLGLGAALLEQQSLSRARQVFSRVIELEPKHPEALEGMGLALLAEGRIDEATEMLEAALWQDTERWRAWNGLGVIADLDAEPRVAAAHYQRARDAGGDNELVANNRGYSLLMAGEIGAAERELLRATQRYPRSRRLRGNLALAMAHQGRYEDTVKTLKTIHPEHEALNNAGYLAMLNDDHDIAVQLLRRSTEASPRHYPRAEANLERALQERERVSAESR